MTASAGRGYVMAIPASSVADHGACFPHLTDVSIALGDVCFLG
jgi:hypothetical protein